ncbi:thiamine phosphate synthase [Oricola cellulosilytica]|uniref:Thiamine phosphate synthase n=1 Tax=Oricola cellulosilytica TaxID=1429082 RepID=A0A4R0P8D7_9HYPH|nr:thiamine phosphate synthase [Oricola cellulosilytica]TCD13332.1 thiamine phosphate synthase [Oricola cellulosilytica]
MTRKFDLDPFYPVVGSSGWITRLAPLGIRLIQLRVKDRAPAEIRAEVRRARDLCAAHGCALVVNDHWQTAIEERCEWVHLGQGDLDSADVPAIRRAGIGLGLSTHDHAELDRALSHDPDYVALGPVYPTILKKMPWAPQGLAKVAEWKNLIGDRPLVAIGGLNPERLPGVFAAGADIAAVVTDISLHADPQERTRQWLDATRKGTA